MNSYKYMKIDAFTSEKSLGNPAACLYLKKGQSLAPEEMLAVAKQHKGFVMEMVFCSDVTEDGCRLVYYSSECEVDFCGHGTVACMYTLIKDTPEFLGRREITIDTNKKGRLTIYNEIPKQDAIYITAPDPVFIGTSLERAEIAGELGVNAADISEERPIDLIDAGLRTLIVPVAKLETEINIFPDELGLKNFCEANGIDIILVYSTEVSDGRNIAHTRVFAPKFGYLEDPATGSGNSAFANYMLKNKMWDGTSASVEQGGSDRAFNIVKLSTRGGKVLFGGGATTRIRGEYFV
ncbi:MAG: PhzF family phenazine biosynthesis isomerase [Synergistaceae bacterium]|nr:PhzF family phenazine biosynthesis isomerase [Synergistaceae bacterium]